MGVLKFDGGQTTLRQAISSRSFNHKIEGVAVYGI
jgi:hypothetical protein